MNREIKFRAWDGRQWSYFTIGQTMTGYMQAVYDDHCLLSRQFFQYTGLKDKNGKEIYFGDILVTSNSNTEYDLWTKEDYGYTVCQDLDDELGVSWSNWAPDSPDESSVYSLIFCEVVGNVFENPELL